MDAQCSTDDGVSYHGALGSPREFPDVWNELRQNDQLCDGVIRCRDGRIIKIHRAILSAVSPYFRAIFTNSLRSGCKEETQVSVDIDVELLSSILDFAYTGTCTINSENVEALLPAADQYEVLGVIQLCCNFLSKELRIDNCLGILRFAKHYFCRDLEYNSMHFALVNFKTVMHESPEYRHLQFQELSALLRDDELNVRTEEIVFEAIKTWTDYDRENRAQYVPELLTTVRFGLMTYKFFTSDVLRWEVINTSTKCLDALYPASMFLTQTSSKAEGGETDLNDPLARPRIPHEVLFAIGGWSAGSPTSFVETYDTRADKWFLSVNTDLTPRAYHGVCALNNLIYMVGGFDGNEHFNTVRCYNPLTKVWQERACMYHARCYVSVVAHDGWVYALGGYNGRNRMCSAERYDPTRNQWEMVTPMNKQRSDASAASLKNKIYIVGGFNGQEVLVSGEVYDPSTLQWTYIPQMNNPRSGVSLVAHKDTLYALGGFSGFTRLNSAEKYCPDSVNEWCAIADMYSPRSNFAAVVLDGMIFAIGGFNGTTTISYVEVYDPETNDWFDCTSMNLNRSALSACVLSGLPNTREYSYLSKSLEHEQGGGGARCQMEEA
ncbi:kelch-like protein 10 [Ctenocephalides felis]|uniref:kelch-like protein 10 n=1 Tax=Ctenocephalides felis TaxID=7515 RepID=UPI000E6E16D5|nr:kelch-like protein 10 [Ctenocephalides felis]